MPNLLWHNLLCLLINLRQVGSWIENWVREKIKKQRFNIQTKGDILLCNKL